MLHPLKGNFSISVTNDKAVLPDTTCGILSGILLRSELRGHIENPEYYFQRTKDSETAADLLMKTNGWTRYAVPDVLLGKFNYPAIPYETSQQFTGTVKTGLFSRLAKNFNVSLSSLEFLDYVQTDENGRFVFDNFEFPDSTKYIFQALNAKGGGRRTIELHLDQDSFPVILSAWDIPMVQEEQSDQEILDYVAIADMNYTYEHGRRMINLPEVQVRGSRRESRKYKSFLYAMPDYFLPSEEIERYAGGSFRSLLYRLPGVFVSGNTVRIRGQIPIIMINDFKIFRPTGDAYNDEIEFMHILEMINIDDVGQVDLITSKTKAMLTGGVAIVIHSKKGEIFKSLPFLNIKDATPLGYQLPVGFYSPKYDTQERIDDPKPDLRTTIYWKPDVITDDEGNATVNFYSADESASYSIIIEGISDDGALIRYYGKSLITVD